MKKIIFLLLFAYKISFAQTINIGGTINSYTPVISFNSCNNAISVEDASEFIVGDTVLLIQMKGAVTDSTNSAAFGTITDYKNAGNYEFNYIKSISGNIIEFKNSLNRQYDLPNGRVQLVRVPYYHSANVTSSLTCLPWDGRKGGVLVLNVRDTIELNADIDVSGKGFKGGNGVHTVPANFNCNENQFYFPANNELAAGKGESISILSPDKSYGKGNLANGGGGGNSHNAGGGGGSNAASGGLGGFQFEGSPCNTTVPFDNRGIGGTGLTYSNTSNRIFLGGGGGAGHANNPELFYPTGGNGGGICIIITNVVKGNNKNILANGENGLECIGYGLTGCHEGMGGGGGGGVILLKVNNYFSTTIPKVNGGKGADMVQAGNLKVGPGGGGSGGVCWINNLSVPSNLLISADPGTNGICTGYSNDPWGAGAGLSGISLFNLIIPVDTTPFLPNIDSVRIKDSLTGCNMYYFKGFGFTRLYSINQWQWNFGDNQTADIQNPTHMYAVGGTYTVKLIVTDINGCKDSTITSITTSSVINFDFSYKQDICNPLSVQFYHIGNSPTANYWSFGDGNSITGTTTPTHIYNATGNYTIKYSITNGTCTDTITKIISVNILNDDIINTADTTICINSTKQLLTTSVLSFCWSPATYLNDPTIPNPITSSPVPITYYFTAEVQGNNLITNGGFNSGNSGFTSQYNFASPNTTEGEYFVGVNPQAWNSSLSNCPDHTTGNGNMLLVNGAPIADVTVWTQSVTVVPNTNYAFSTWIQALFPQNPAELGFSINGGNLGNLITAGLPTCTWDQFYTTWNSGNNTIATISIINKNTQVQGNDFALDDISFSPVLIKRDSVKITVDTPRIKANADTSICLGNPVQLTATGGVSYSWSPSTGLNNSGIPNPVATPANNTQYIVTGINSQGCIANDTINIFIKPLPLITKSSDTSICRNSVIQLNAGGGTIYSWSPATTLNNASIANPIATPSGNTTYKVTVTGLNSCSNIDSVKISILPLPVFSISPDKSTCANSVTSLLAGGGSTYLWSPAALVSNPNIPNPTTSTKTSTTFSVKIKDNTCLDSTTMSTRITVLPSPMVQAAKLNDIDCVSSIAQLTASGAGKYIWSPSTGLNNPNIFNPTATITAQQQYIVTGTDTLSNCSGQDTLTVFIKGISDPAFFVPNAFSPNGDGLNDCFRINHYGTVKSLEMSVFNRMGNRVFYTKNVNDCWDGNYKGKPANQDNYVYYIKSFNDCGENTRKGNLLLLR